MDVIEPEIYETVAVSGRGGQFSDVGAGRARCDEQAINVRDRH
jgi:hypothetical protein